jgi:hypothetical protein
MTDPANIEALQVAKLQEARRAVALDAVQRLLVALDYQDSDATLDYRGLLTRAHAVIATELAQEGA